MSKTTLDYIEDERNPERFIHGDIRKNIKKDFERILIMVEDLGNSDTEIYEPKNLEARDELICKIKNMIDILKTDVLDISKNLIVSEYVAFDYSIKNPFSENIFENNTVIIRRDSKNFYFITESAFDRIIERFSIDDEKITMKKYSDKFSSLFNEYDIQNIEDSISKLEYLPEFDS